MEDSKQWYTSKAIWGTIIMLASPVLNKLFHLTISDDQSNALAAQIVDIVQYIQLLVGGILGIWGRITASKSIAPVVTPK